MTKVFFRFDTEDYTSDGSWDMTIRIAELLRKYEIKGCFNIVGYLAREWARQGRMDVPEALKYHDIGFHTLRHSFHPTVCEYTDLEDYDEARMRLLAQEAQGIGMVKAVTGRHDIKVFSMPGISISYVAYYEYARLGMSVNTGYFWYSKSGEPFRYCNLSFLPITYMLDNVFHNRTLRDGSPYDLKTLPDIMAKHDYIGFGNHPNIAVYREHWDKVNYYKENKHPMYEWEEAPKYSPEEQEAFLEDFEKLIVTLKNDGRFEFVSLNDVADRTRREDEARVMTREDVPEVLRQLKEKLWFVTLPSGTFSLTDCFAAAAHFLSSNEPYKPAFVRGFLDTPAGVTEPVTLSASEIKAAVKPYEPDTFLPNVFEVGGKKIGPADLLFAMLEAACGADTVTVLPKPQEPDLTEKYDMFHHIKLAHNWIHADSLEDNYLTKRLCLQSWTLRE